MPDLAELFRLADHEDDATNIQVNIRVTRELKEMLERTAVLARASQAGTVRVALRLVAQRVARRWGAES